MSQDILIDNVKSWLTIDNDIKKLQKAIKLKRKEKKDLTNDLMDIITLLDCIHLLCFPKYKHNTRQDKNTIYCDK